MKQGDLPAAFVAGGAAVIGYAPFSLPVAFAPASLFALAVLVWLLRRAQSVRLAALLGGLWGLGFFLAGVSWVYVSMARFSGLPAWAAALATLAFCAWLAVFPALASAAWARLRGSRPGMSALTFAACWTLAEWLRGTLLTGFPWLAAGYAHTPPSPLAGFAPVAGVYGVGFAAALTAALLARLADAGARGRALAGIAAIATAVALLMHMSWTAPNGPPMRVALLQGDVAQDVKWDPARLQVSFDRYAALAAAPGEAGAPPPELLVLPETALPLMLVGYEIINANDGADALERLGREAVDMVVTDLEMPRVDGLELTRRVKSHPTLHALPVVIVTTRGSETDRRKGMDAGADGYITKGDLVRQDLVDVVSRLLA